MKKIIGYNILIVAIIIGLLEISLRLFSSINELGYQENLFKKDSKIILHNPNIESVVFGNKVFTDNYGFRVPHKKYDYNKLIDQSILILGDSVSFGVGIDEEKTFIGQIRKKYSKINIFNSSVSGHNSLDHLNLLEFFYDKIKFNKIIIFYCLNDIISSPGVVINKSSYKQNYFLSKINVFLRNKSFIYIFLKSKFTNPEKRYYDYLLPLYQNEKSIDFTKKVFNKISKFSINHNLDLTVVILPYKYQVEKNSCAKELLFPQDVIKKIFTLNKIEYYDLTNNFCINDQNNLFLKYDPVHLSVNGHSLVFKELDKLLKFDN